jgi:hypothetical protein
MISPAASFSIVLQPSVILYGPAGILRIIVSDRFFCVCVCVRACVRACVCKSDINQAKLVSVNMERETKWSTGDTCVVKRRINLSYTLRDVGHVF